MQSYRKQISFFARITLVVFLFFGASILACSEHRKLSESDIRAQYQNSVVYQESALFLAGMDIPKDSPLYSITQTKEYQQYRSQIEQLWNNYNTNQLKNIRKWKDSRVRHRDAGLLFYPFSGPDILNALAFFPGADEIVMMGLEAPGDIPDIRKIPRNKVIYDLWNMKNAMRTLLRLNLFRTSEMQADLRANSFNSITGIMMFFIARSGYEVLDVHKIHINGKGELINGELPGRRYQNGVEIVFRQKRGAYLQRLRFFSLNLADDNLKTAPSIMKYFNRYNNFTTLIKSASYLLANLGFSNMRNFVLARSKYLVQDDSGIPVKYFAPAEWDMSFYGNYTLLQMFKDRFQPDLDKLAKAKSKEKLPFSYGYGFVPERSLVMVAKKKTK